MNLDPTEPLEQAREKLNREILEIEDRDDLSDDQKAQQIILMFSSLCAGIAVQPIPFADIFILTPIQGYMATRLAAIRGVPVSEETAAQILKDIAAVCGLGFLGQQLAIGAYKTVLPFLGAVTTIPLVFGLSFGIGQVLDAYFLHRARGKRLSDSEIQRIWKSARSQGEKYAKENKDELPSVHGIVP